MTGKPARRTRAELRELMLRAGQEVLHAVEPTLGFEDLTYSAVFDHLEDNYGHRVTIGSVHGRIWKNQRDFRLDVIAQALRDLVQPESELAQRRALDAINQLDLSTPRLRRYALQSAIRLNAAHLSSSPQQQSLDLAQTVRFRLWSLGPDHPEAAHLRGHIEQLRSESTAAYATVARCIAEAVGARVRPEIQDPDRVFELLAVLANAVLVGLRTDVVPPAQSVQQLPTGLNGELEDWYPDAIALWSYTQAFLELEGDELSADERRL